MCPQFPVWDPRLELEGVAIPQSSSIREFQKGHAHHLVEALEQALLLLKDMASLQNMRQPGLFLSLKKDLALVSFWSCLFNFMLSYPSPPFFLHNIPLLFFAHAIQEVFMAKEWVNDACYEAKVKANLRAETSKALGPAEKKNKELNAKLTTKEKERRSTEAGLKNT